MPGSVKDVIDLAAGEVAACEGAAEVSVPCLLGCFCTAPDTSIDTASTTETSKTSNNSELLLRFGFLDRRSSTPAILLSLTVGLQRWPRRAAHVRARASESARERESERARDGGR